MRDRSAQMKGLLANIIETNRKMQLELWNDKLEFLGLKAALALIGHLGPTDQAAMMSTRGQKQYQVEFTTDRARLAKALVTLAPSVACAGTSDQRGCGERPSIGPAQ